MGRSRSGFCCAWSAATATSRLRATSHPEFDAWRWHDYWVPLDTVIEFKRDVYQQALLELSRYVFKSGRQLVKTLRESAAASTESVSKAG